MPKISVLMTHYNDPYLPKAVESLLSQSFKDFELLIADDCSNNPDFIDSLGGLIEDRRMSIYRSSKNVGTYRLKNKMLSIVDSEFVAFHDSDDLSRSDRFETQLEYLLVNKKVSLVGSCFYELKPRVGFRKVRMPKFPALSKFLGQNYVSLHPTWMVRKNMLVKLNGFDGTTRIAADDDFFNRLLLVSSARNIQDFLYTKRDHDSSLTGSSLTGHKSKIRLDYKCNMEVRIQNLKRMNSARRNKAILAPENDIDFNLVSVK